VVVTQRDAEGEAGIPDLDALGSIVEDVVDQGLFVFGLPASSLVRMFHGRTEVVIDPGRRSIDKLCNLTVVLPLLLVLGGKLERGQTRHFTICHLLLRLM